jgi:hypothetical protein
MHSEILRELSLVNRLLTQMERMHEITKAVVETAREPLVIGEA